MKRKKWHCIAVFSVIAALSFSIGQSCNKAKQHFEVLAGQLQLAGGTYDYKSFYSVGDTILFYGLFGSVNNDLKITIGETAAPVISRTLIKTVSNLTEGVTYDSVIQLVKVKVDTTMGTGTGRSVVFTMGVQRLVGKPINIGSSANDGLLADTLFMKTTDVVVKKTNWYIQSWNGSGRVFYFDLEEQKIRVWDQADQKTSIVLENFSDAEGRFSILEIRDAHVDRRENYLYFAAKTENIPDSEAERNIERFCKLDLRTHVFTTLNSKSVPVDRTFTEAELAGPYEGPVSAINLPFISKLFVKENGDVHIFSAGFTGTNITGSGYAGAYLDQGYVIYGKMTEAGNLTYSTGTMYDHNYNLLLQKPGFLFTNHPSDASGYISNDLIVDPENEKIYLHFKLSLVPFNIYALSQYDLKNNRETGFFYPENAVGGVENVINAPFISAKFNNNGVWILKDGQPLVILGNGTYRGTAIVRIDFEKKTCSAYANALNAGFMDFSSKPRHLPLNTTPDGNIIFWSDIDPSRDHTAVVPAIQITSVKR